MAELNFSTIKKEYEDFKHPSAVVYVNDKSLSDKKFDIAVSELNVEITSGFEASTCDFNIVGVYSTEKAEFLTEKIKKILYLGSKVEVMLGYVTSGNKGVRRVFLGYISAINFVYDSEESMPYIRVTAMDVKGIMMSSSYCYQLKGKSYSEGVNEILEKTAYTKLQDKEIITSIEVEKTPDQKRIEKDASNGGKGFLDRTVEMVGESDYEFVVRAAKRYNYEFFVLRGRVIFRKAKSDKSILISINPSTGLRKFDVGYDITGLVETVTARGVDNGKVKSFSAKEKYNQKISNGNYAKALIKGSQKTYVDPSITSPDEAQDRAKSLYEQMSYRYGRLECDLVGLPHLEPGRFVEIRTLGMGVENEFYITKVRHTFDREGYFITHLTGICSEQYNPSAISIPSF